MTDIVQQVAMKAVIVHKGKVLLLRENKAHDTNTNGGRYQLPGGRVEPGEVFSEALDREIDEETGLKVKQLQPILVGEWRPVIKGTPHQIIGVFIVCEASSDEVKLSEEHDGYAWIDPHKYADYNVLQPDCDAVASFSKNCG